MPARTTLVPLLAAAALALAVAFAPPAHAAAKARVHPDVKGEQECATCHRTDTPQAFQAWENGPHGIALVKCVTCHGSTGADFRARPAATAAACQGCHATAVASVSRRSVKDCFACHDPHTLSPNPHR